MDFERNVLVPRDLQEKPLITVVVPVYNVESVLDWCLDSLHGQTLSAIQIVCVNDGSTDGSREVLRRHAEKDARIQIVDKPNGGLSSARNAGVKEAKAPYVCFLDSDDRFVPHACERMVEAFAETNADVLTFGANCYPSEAGYPWLIDVLSPRNAVYDSFSVDILFKEKSRPFAWRTACRTSFLIESKVEFDESVRFGEDQVFHFAIYPRASITAFIEDKLYDYRVSREGSLMDRMLKDPRTMLLEHVKIAQCVYEDWERGGFLDSHAAKMASWAVEFVLYDALKLEGRNYKEVASAMAKVLTAHFGEGFVTNGEISAATRAILHDAVCNGAEAGQMGRKLMAAKYYVQQYGWKAVLAKFMRK